MPHVRVRAICILDSIRSRPARVLRKEPTRAACTLALATDFGRMHLLPAVKGLSVL